MALLFLTAETGRITGAWFLSIFCHGSCVNLIFSIPHSHSPILPIPHSPTLSSHPVILTHLPEGIEMFLSHSPVGQERATYLSDAFFSLCFACWEGCATMTPVNANVFMTLSGLRTLLTSLRSVSMSSEFTSSSNATFNNYNRSVKCTYKLIHCEDFTIDFTSR